MRFKRNYKKRHLLLLLLVLVGLSALLIPNRAGILKAINFWEKEWIPSTSGALYETQNQAFVARIGNSADPKQVKLFYSLSGKDFTLELVKNVASPSPTLLTDTSTESASINEAIQIINANVASIESEALTISGDTTQSFFGPHETVRQNQIFGGSLSYYLANTNLNEEWQIVDHTDQLSFLYTSKDVFLKVNPNGDWTVASADAKLLDIKTLFTAADGTTATPEYAEEKTISTSDSGQMVTLSLPSSWVSDYEKKFPVKITRTYSPSNQNVSQSSNEITYPTSSNPTSVAPFGSQVIVADPTNQTLSLVSQNTNDVLLSSLPFTYVSCTTKLCYASTVSDIYEFDPLLLLQEPDMQKRLAKIKRIQIGLPIGGLAATKTKLYGTNNSNPNGTLFVFDTTGNAQIIKENLTFPTTISIAPDEKTEVLFVNGQVLYKTSASDWKILDVSLTPKSLAAGNDNFLYFITDYPRTHEDIIVRINVTTSIVEVLAKVGGKFTTLLPTSDMLYLSSSDQNSGWILPIPLSETRWVTTTEFTAQ